MTDNFDEHEHEEHHDDFVEHEIPLSEQGKSSGMASNLTEAWRTKPLFKFMVLLIAVFAVGVAAFNFLGGSDKQLDIAHLAHPPEMKEAPGGAVSPYMREQTELANKERTEQAAATGGSALPTPIGQTTDVGNFGASDKKDDQLNELRAETDMLRKQMAQQQVQQQQTNRQPEQFDNSLAEAMQRQMQQLLEGWTPKGIKAVTVVKPEDNKNAVAADANAANGTTPATATGNPAPKAIVNAGTVSYGQLMTEANSDVPGPILAQIVSGPLAGARAVGSFEVATGYEKYLVLKFTIADKKGKDYQISAVALDPDTTLGGMATEVDERYFTRVVLPAAAGFLEGMGQALGQGNTSITTNGTTSISQTSSNGFHQGIYQGMGQAAQTAAQFFQQQADVTKPLVRVASGTPIGIFFVTPVYEPNADGSYGGPAALNPANAINPNGINGGYPNGYGNGYPNGNNSVPYPYPGSTNGYPSIGLNNNNGYNGTTVNGYGGYGNGYGYSNQQNVNTNVPYPNAIGH